MADIVYDSGVSKLYHGDCRAAIVSRVWPGGDTIQCTVFFDGTNDGAGKSAAEWRTSVLHREDKNEPEGLYQVRTWHWPH